MSSVLLVISICLLAWTLFTILIRLYMRRYVNGPFSHDDTVAVIGTICAITHTSLGYRAINLWNAGDIDNGIKTDLGMSILYLAAVTSSRISTALLLARLERKDFNIWLIRGIMALSTAWFLAGAIAVGVYERRGCSTSFPLWFGLEVVSMILELVVMVSVIALVWDLRMAMQSKVVVVLSFATRLVVIAPVTLRLLSMDSSSCSKTFFGSDTMFAIYTLLVVHISIMVATFSCIKQFLGAFDSGAFGTGLLDKGGAGSQLRSFEMASQMSGHGGSALRSRRLSSPEAQKLQLRPDKGYTVTEVRSGKMGTPAEASSVNSDASERAIITKTQRWETSVSHGDVHGEDLDAKTSTMTSNMSR